METNIDKLRNKLGPFMNLVAMMNADVPHEEPNWKSYQDRMTLIGKESQVAFGLMPEVYELLTKIEREINEYKAGDWTKDHL